MKPYKLLMSFLLSLYLCSCSLVEKLLEGPKEVIQGERRDVINYIPHNLKPQPQPQLHLAPITEETEQRKGNVSIQGLDYTTTNWAINSNRPLLKITNRFYFNSRYNIENPSLPAFEQDILYLLEADGIVSAIDLKQKSLFLNTKKTWQNNYLQKYIDSKYARKYIAGGLAIYKNLLFVSNGTNEIIAINKTNGTLIWQRMLSSPVRQPPLVFTANNLQEANQSLNDKLLILQGMNGTIYALNLEDGSNVWTSFDNSTSIQALTSIFSLAEDKVISINSNDKITVIKLQNGELVWQLNPIPTMLNGEKETNLTAALRTHENPIANAPINEAGSSYLVMLNGIIASINTDNSNIKWQKNYFVYKPMWLSGDLLYAINKQNKVLALNSNNGEILWLYNLDQAESITQFAKFSPSMNQILKDKNKKLAWTAPIIASNCLLTMREDGLLLIFNAEKGLLLHSVKINTNHVTMLTIKNQKIYAISSGGIVTQIEVISN